MELTFCVYEFTFCVRFHPADDNRYMHSARVALLQCLDRMNLQNADRLTVVDFNSSQNAGWWSSECDAAVCVMGMLGLLD